MKQLVDSEEHKAGEIYLKVKGKGVPSRYLSALYRYEDYKTVFSGISPKTAVESSSSLSRR
jgi:hypothetical protein